MQCKGKPKKRKRKKKTTTKTKKIWTGKSCRVCTRHLVEGDNWAPSRVKRHDYICSSCHRAGRKASSRTRSSASSSSKNCPKCNAKMVKRYSPKNSQHFWGCPNFPRCTGARRL